MGRSLNRSVPSTMHSICPPVGCRTLPVVIILGVVGASARSSDVLIKHQSENGEIAVEHGKPVGHFAPGAKIELRARHGEQVNLIVTDPNTLVFSYTPGERTEAKTADFEALKKLADVFQQLFPTQPATKSLKGILKAVPRCRRNPRKLSQWHHDRSEAYRGHGILERSCGKRRLASVAQSVQGPLTDDDLNASLAERSQQVEQLLKFFRAVGARFRQSSLKTITVAAPGRNPEP